MMIIAKNARFKKILIVCLAVLIVSGATGAYFKIFKNADTTIKTNKTVNANKAISTDKTVNADTTVNANKTTNVDKAVNTENTANSEKIDKDNSVERKAQFILLPSKRLIMGNIVQDNPALGYAKSVKFDHDDMIAMNNDVFYYLDMNGERILTFKTFADPDDYKYYRCIAITSNHILPTGKESVTTMPISRMDLEMGKAPYMNENGLIGNYYCDAKAWIDTEKNAIESAEEIKQGKLFFSCILTTLDDTGNPEGGIDPKTQKLYGKYYTSYEAFVKARTWKNTENFKKYFNNKIVFPHLEDFQRDAAEYKPDTGSKAKT